MGAGSGKEYERFGPDWQIIVSKTFVWASSFYIYTISQSTYAYHSIAHPNVRTNRHRDVTFQQKRLFCLGQSLSVCVIYMCLHPDWQGNMHTVENLRYVKLSVWQWQYFCLCESSSSSSSSSWYWLYITTSSCATTVNCCQYVKCEKATTTNIGNDSSFHIFSFLTRFNQFIFGTGKHILLSYHTKPVYEHSVCKLNFIRIKLFN